MIRLAEATNDSEDMDALADWLKTYPHLTQGPLTKEYEAKWSSYLGVKESIFVNSGSSANLLMLYTLMESGDLAPGDSVVVPSLSWATDLAPVIQLGLTPVLCDCNLDDFSLDLNNLKDLLYQPRQNPIKAIILVPILGFVPDMKEIIHLCNEHDVVLLEDCCESLGSSYGGRKLGTFGAMSTFSTFFGHHISTIEGGMVCTSNPEYARILKSIRAHGWDRDWTDEQKKEFRDLWEVSDFDALYTFYHTGFNCRGTDLQAFLGIRQLDKLDDIVKARNLNYLTYRRFFGMEDPQDQEKFVSNFAFPVLSSNRERITASLLDNDIETRPIICGSLGEQPFYVKQYGRRVLPNANKVKKTGFYLPNHHLLKEKDIKKIVEVCKNA